jgi:hypothetical protein
MLSPISTGKYFEQTSLDGVISRYDYSENGKVTNTFKTNEILWSKIDDLDNPLIGVSPLVGLEFPISNTELAYKYLNCISGERGALGILNKVPSKDAMGALPRSPKEEKEMEEAYKKAYGVEDGKMKTMITSLNVNYTPTSYPTQQLLLLEQIDANANTILDSLGVNRNLFNPSTYENLQTGLLSTHNDTVVPDADSLAQNLTPFIGMPEGYKLVLDYSHSPYLQKDKVKEATTLEQVSSALNQLVMSQIISKEEAKQILASQFNVDVKS